MIKKLKYLTTFSRCGICIILMSLPFYSYSYANVNKIPQRQGDRYEAFLKNKRLHESLAARFEKPTNVSDVKQKLNWHVVPGVTGGNIRSLVNIGDVIFAGAHGDYSGVGVFKSINHGKSWIKSGLQNTSVNVLRECDGIIYAAVDPGDAQGGVSYSADDGKTWHFMGTIGDVSALAVSHDAIYTITDFDILLHDPKGSKTWESIGNSFFLYTAIATDHGLLYAGTSENGLLEYRIKEKKWEHLGFLNKSVNTIKFNEGSLYVGTGDGLYHYIKNTKKWEFVGLKGKSIRTIHFHDNTIAVGTKIGFFISNNNGKTWLKANTGLVNKQIDAMLFTQDNDIYVSTPAAGIFKSVNQGKNWHAVNNGLTFSPITSLTSYKNNVYVGLKGGGIFIGKNNGQVWHVSNRGLADPNITTLITCGSTIYAGTFEGVFKNMGGSAVWNSANTGLGKNRVLSLAADNGGAVYAGSDHGVFTTVNAGRLWQFLGLDNYSDKLIVVDKSNNIIYTYANDNGWPTRVFKCKKDRCSWEEIPFLKNKHLDNLAVDDKGVIYASGYDGFFISEDEGQSWKDSPSVPSMINTLTTVHDIVYVGTAFGNVLESKDRGDTWVKLTTQPIPDIVTSLVVVGSKIYAGTENHGLYMCNYSAKK